MSSKIIEFYGAAPRSAASLENAKHHHCPFVNNNCIKNKTKSLGACSLQVGDAAPVIICPNRLYTNHFGVLVDVATQVFGQILELVSPEAHEIRRRAGKLTGSELVVFGKYFGGELGIPTPPGLEEDEAKGSFYIDFLLAKPDSQGKVSEFAAVEVQTIDTTDSYAKAAAAYKGNLPYAGDHGADLTKAGLNWENVTKRILPQLIYKGHALRREPMCKKGLFFVLPHAVFERIKRRVGGKLTIYPPSPGTITFRTYDLGPENGGSERQLVFRETLTTTVDVLANAFVSPQNLPEAGVYESVLTKTLAKYARKRKLSGAELSIAQVSPKT
jgi:hypothetical protein